MKAWIPFLFLVCGLLAGCQKHHQQPAIHAIQPYQVKQLGQVEAKVWLLRKHPNRPLLAIQAGVLDEPSPADGIVVLNPDNKQELFSKHGFHPIWSPDGQALYFNQVEGRSVSIWKYDLTTNQLTRVFRQDNHQLFLPQDEQCWLSRSSLVVVGKKRGKEPDVYVLDLERKTLVPLVLGINPVIHTAGQLVAYRDSNRSLARVRIRSLASSSNTEWHSLQQNWIEIRWNHASGSLVGSNKLKGSDIWRLTVWSGKHPHWSEIVSKSLSNISDVSLVDTGDLVLVVAESDTRFATGEHEVSVLRGDTLEIVTKFITRSPIEGISFDRSENWLILALVQDKRSTLWAVEVKGGSK